MTDPTDYARGRLDGYAEAREQAAREVALAGYRIFEDVFGRSGNKGVATMRAKPLWTLAEQLRAMQPEPAPAEADGDGNG